MAPATREEEDHPPEPTAISGGGGNDKPECGIFSLTSLPRVGGGNGNFSILSAAQAKLSALTLFRAGGGAGKGGTSSPDHTRNSTHFCGAPSAESQKMKQMISKLSPTCASVPPRGVSWTLNNKEKFTTMPDAVYREKLRPEVLCEITSLASPTKTRRRARRGTASPGCGGNQDAQSSSSLSRRTRLPRLSGRGKDAEMVTPVHPGSNPFVVPGGGRPVSPPGRLPPLSKVLRIFHTEKHRKTALKEAEEIRRAVQEKRKKTALEHLREALPILEEAEAPPLPPHLEVQLTAQRLMEQFVLSSCKRGGGCGPKVSLYSSFFVVGAVCYVVRKMVSRLRTRQAAAVFAALENFIHNRTLTVLPRRVVKQLWYGFRALDDDHSGCVSLREFQQNALRVGKQVDPVIFRRLDRDRSGTVNFPELLRTLYPCVPRKVLEEQIRQVSTFDVSVSWEAAFTRELLIDIAGVYGYLTHGGGEKYSFATYQKQAPRDCMTEEELRGQFAEADIDRDGLLSFKEYALSMRSTFKDELLGQEDL